MARLQDAVRPRRVGDHGAAEHDADALAGGLDARRPWVVPDGFAHRSTHLPRYRFGGMSTLLMTWMTPFEAMTSALVTRAPPT